MKEQVRRYKNREELIQALIERMNAVLRMVRMYHKPPPLSPPNMHLLFMIAMSDKGKSVKELAELSGVTPGAISQLITNLVERGMVVREDDPNDRRVVRLRLTELAREKMNIMKKDYFGSAKKVLETLHNDELRQLVDIFSKIEAFQEKDETVS